MEIDQYVKDFNRTRDAVGGDTTVAVALVIEAAKDRRTDEINKSGGGRSNGNGHGKSEPATPNQLGFLKKLGIAASPGLSKAEASKLIDEATGK